MPRLSVGVRLVGDEAAAELGLDAGLLGRCGGRLELLAGLVVDLVGRDRVDHVGEPTRPSRSAPWSRTGCVTETSFASVALARLASTAALLEASVSFSPSGAANTSRA